MNKWIITLCLFGLLYRHASGGEVGFIGTFLRSNIVGHPIIHEKQTWIFDPDVALRRRKQFVELNGDKGDKLIERLGLGDDGYDEERLKFQRERDEGHLGGLNAHLP